MRSKNRLLSWGLDEGSLFWQQDLKARLKVRLVVGGCLGCSGGGHLPPGPVAGGDSKNQMLF